MSEVKMSANTSMTTAVGAGDRLMSLVVNGKAANTQAAYRHALREFQGWVGMNGNAANGGAFSRENVLAWVQHLQDEGYAHATINQRLSAVRALAKEVRYMSGVSTAAKERAEGILAVEGLVRRGRRLGHWLSDGQARALLALPERVTLKGKQEYAVLALLLGAGLRREEAARLVWSQVQERDGRALIVDLLGKGHKTRSIHLSPWVVKGLDQWRTATGCDAGLVLLAVNRGDRLAGPVRTRGGGKTDGGLSDQAIYNLIKDLAGQIKVPDLGPHSLRRTWARKAYKMGYPLDQISLMLGHASLKTTEIYLGLDSLDLDNPVHVEF